MNVTAAPFVGALVRYVLPNSPEHIAAIVTHVHPDGRSVNLTGFWPNGVPGPILGVREDQHENPAHGTWHWRTE